MRDLVLTAPEELRHRLRGRSIAGLIAACSALRPRGSDGIEMRVRVQSLRRLARRARALTEDAKTVEADLQASLPRTFRSSWPSPASARSWRRSCG
jgi:transposase